MNLKSYRMLKIAAVCDKTGCSKSKIYSLIKEDQFPHPVRIGGASRWIEHEVDMALAFYAMDRECDVFDPEREG